MKIKPLNDRVLVVREEKEQKSTGGITDKPQKKSTATTMADMDEDMY